LTTPISSRHCALLTAALVLLLALALAGCGGKKARSCKLSGFTAAPGSPYAVGKSSSLPVVADFNGDGHPDLAVAGEDSNDVSVLLGDGSGGFTVASGSPYAVGKGPLLPVVADFNGDGHPDIAVASRSRDVSVLLGNGSGGFTAAPGSPFAVGKLPYWPVVGDFNGDGHPDLAVSNLFSNGVSVLLGDGSGGFTAAPGSPLAVGKYPSLPVVADFDGDGHPDLVVDSGSNGVSVLLGDGSGGFTAAPGSPLAVGKSSFLPVVADFNGDGHPDLAVAGEDSNDVSVLLNSCS
jgi:hypothetical protein